MSRRDLISSSPSPGRAVGVTRSGRAAMAVAALSMTLGALVVPAPAEAATESPGATVTLEAVEAAGDSPDARRAERQAQREARRAERERARAERERRRADRLEERRLRFHDPFKGVAAGRDDIGECAAFDARETLTLRELNTAINADDAHQLGVDGAGVDIAVIDTGVMEVTGLQGQVVEGIDLSFDQGVPDLRGQDLHGHGTAMASIAASDGALGGDGVAPGARVVDVRVGAGDGGVDVSQVIAAIDWVVANRDTDGRNIRVITLAYNTDSDQDPGIDPLSRAVEDAWNAGIVVVVAGGNEGERRAGLGSPARNPYVIAVGGARADGRDWQAAPWSSYGDEDRDVDVLAPGERVLGAGVAGSYLTTNHPQAACAADGDVYLRGSGTSQAAAAVAGASALLLDDRPELTPDQVKWLLSRSAETVHGDKRQRGDGLIDVREALSDETPGEKSTQDHEPSSGLGSLEAARGSLFVGPAGDQLHGEMTVFGTVWDPEAWLAAKDEGTVWLLDAAGEATWMGATWSGATWSGATWSGATWSGATWSGATWASGSWTGASWTGASWTGASWTGASWT